MRPDFWNRAWFEKYLPLAIGFFTFAICFCYRFDISSLFGPDKWSSNNLYGAIFNWSSIQSGFIFAVYGFVVTKRDGFVSIIVSGVSFERFLRFTKRACLGGFALSISSLPLLVVTPKIESSNMLMYAVISAWFSLFVWAFFAFLRVAFTFGVIVGTRDIKDTLPG